MIQHAIEMDPVMPDTTWASMMMGGGGAIIFGWVDLVRFGEESDGKSPRIEQQRNAGHVSDRTEQKRKDICGLGQMDGVIFFFVIQNSWDLHL